jgi:hypothetical protein
MVMQRPHPAPLMRCSHPLQPLQKQRTPVKALQVMIEAQSFENENQD